MFFQKILKSKACDQSIQARKKLFCHMIVKNYLCNVKVFDQNRKYVEAQNQRTGNPVAFTVLWQDNQTQPPELLYERAILKNFAISTGSTCIGIYCRPSDQQKRPQHRCFPVNIARFLILPYLIRKTCKYGCFLICQWFSLTWT